MSADDLPVCSAAVDRASEYDRLWFEKHPGAASYVRRRIVGEFSRMEIEDLRWPMDKYPLVEVTQIEPGLRARRPFTHLEILSMS